MQSEQQERSTKKPAATKRKPAQPAEFKTEITLQLDEFFRYFNYYYPNKNKDQIINKSLSIHTYWITVDSLYYAQNVELQTSKIEQFRKKAGLKNGTFPPTKDALEQQKFILLVRKLVSENMLTHNIQQIRSTPINEVVQYLESLLIHQQTINTNTVATLQQMVREDNEQCYYQLEKLGIPFVKSARMFAYEMLEKEVIGKLVEKALMKELQPRCDFCFTRDKQIVKCRTCQLYVHPQCFPKAQKMGNDFQCDQCSKKIPETIHCQLCPLFGGTFLQLCDTAPSTSYTFTRGETNLRFKITRHQKQQRETQYIHVSCFVLHSECAYNLSKGAVQGIHRIDRSKKNASCCTVCGNMIGITVPCHHQNCRRAFHPECAKRNNLNINVIRANNKALLQIYCERHKKAQSYEYLKDSVSNRIKELRKFYQTLDYEIKRYGVNQTVNRPKKPARSEEFLKADRCLNCGGQNDYQRQIVNCKKCYGWYHKACNNDKCTYCEP